MTYRPDQKAIFQTPGTFQWICPPGISHADITVIGAGGGGGGGGGGGTGSGFGSLPLGGFGANGGGGGASGGCGVSGNLITLRSVPVTAGVSYQIVVGAAGTGGSAGAGGTFSSSATVGGVATSGGTSQFNFPNGLNLVATGGVAGVGGPPGGVGVLGTNGSGGASANSLGHPALSAYTYQSPYAAKPNGSDGSQAGASTGSTSSLGAQLSVFAAYQLMTDVTESTLNYPNVNQYYGPFGNSSSLVTGNTLNDTFLTISNPSVFGAGANGGANNVTVTGGGAGGVVSLLNALPIYMIGVDFNLITSSAKLNLPFINSNQGVGLGVGGSTASSGTGNGFAPNSGGTSIGMWRDLTATQFGFGAGGLGGPGGGGAAGTNSSGNVAIGGAGYHGDQGLGGAVMVSFR